jgi:hypothetical protein
MLTDTELVILKYKGKSRTVIAKNRQKSQRTLRGRTKETEKAFY